jgi:large subunit ribosomal protein L16
MLMPKRVKYRKQHRRIPTGRAQRGNYVAFGEFGVQALEGGWITSRQIESARRAITNYVRRGGKVWIRIFPDTPVTQKPAETRMGSGKGAPEYWVAVVKPGRVLFELAGVREDVAKEALSRAAFKLPVKSRFVQREQLGTDAADAAIAAAAEEAANAEAETEVIEAAGVGADD